MCVGGVVSAGSFDLAGVKRAERVRLVEIRGSPEARAASTRFPVEAALHTRPGWLVQVDTTQGMFLRESDQGPPLRDV